MIIMGSNVLFTNVLEEVMKNFNYQTASELFWDYIKDNKVVVDDDYEFHVIVKSDDELRIILKFFNKFQLTNNQTIILKYMTVSTKVVKDVLNEFYNSNVINRLFIDISYDKSGDFIDIDDFDEMQLIIDCVKDTIPDNASNLEIITYVYNWSKKREYKHNSNFPMLSKSYSTSLITEYIVCVGFSKVFNNILSEYGIGATEYKYFHSKNDSDEGHDISMVKVEDDKYGVDGIYFFDLTRDCCYDTDYNNSHKYSGFMMTYDEVKKDIITCDMLGKKLLLDDKDLKDTIDLLKIEVDKLSIEDDDVVDDDQYSPEIMEIIFNLMQIEIDLFKDSTPVNLAFINNPFGAMYYINKYILFIKEHFGIKVDRSIIIDLLVNVIPNQKPGYYLYSIIDYYNDLNNDDLVNHFEYVKKKISC